MTMKSIALTEAQPVTVTNIEWVLMTPVPTEAIETYIEKKTELKKKEAKLAPLKKEVEAAETTILGYVDSQFYAGEPVTLAGSKQLEITARTRAVVGMDKTKIKEIIGPELFDRLAKFTVEDLTMYLTGEQLEAVLTYENKNKRRIKIVG